MTFIMTKQTARQRIHTFLKMHVGSSADEISISLGITSANVRYHLAIMVADGRAINLGTKRVHEKGRSIQIFGPGEPSAKNHLSGLLEAILATNLNSLAEVERETFIDKLADRMFPLRIDGRHDHVTRRFADIINRMNQSDYSARWEAHALAPRIIIDECPYATLINQFPELCRMDRIILEKNIGLSTEQTIKLEKNSRGLRYCQFEIK